MLSTTTRLSNLNAREKRFLVGGTLIALLLLAYLLWPSSAADQSKVELVPAAQRDAAPAAAGQPPAPAPAPVVAAPAAPPAAAATPEGLRLHGVTGAGAIIGYADGSQRYVALGRELLPGLRLQGLRVRHIVLGTATATYRLGFSGPAVGLGAPPAGPAAAPSAAPNRATPAERADTARYRTALAPHMVDGRTVGYAIRPGVSLPLLERAGLRPGDVILMVNGHSLDSGEKIEELASEINAATTTEFEIIRSGRRQRFSLQPSSSR